MNFLDQLPPHDAAAECALIGCVLLRPDTMDDLHLEPRHFYADAHGRLWGHLRAMRDAGEAVDAVLLLARLRDQGDLEAIGGAAYLAELGGAVPHAGHAAHYAARVLRASKHRAIVVASDEAARASYDATDEPEAVADRLEFALMEIAAERDRREPIPVAEAVVQASAEIDAVAQKGAHAGLFTGLQQYDLMHGGFFPGELVILAARPGVGKTALACQIAQHSAERGRAVYFASLEMTASELVKRMACSLSGVSNRLVRTAALRDSDYRDLSAAMQQLAGGAMVLHDCASLTVAQIGRAARRLARRSLSLIVVDYLQLLTAGDAMVKRYEQIGQMTRGLKAMAKELQVPVLCLSQLNREIDRDMREGKKSRPPKLSDLRESGSIEQDADVVTFLHRPMRDDAETQLITAKNRNGAVGNLPLVWCADQTRFEEPTTLRPAGFHEEFAPFSH